MEPRRSASRSRPPSPRTASRLSAPARRRSSASCSRAPTAARSRSAAAASSPSGCATPSTDTSSSGSRSMPPRPGAGSPTPIGPLARSEADVEPPARRAPPPLRGAGRRGRPGRRPWCRRPRPALDPRPSRSPQRGPDDLGDRASRASTRSSSGSGLLGIRTGGRSTAAASAQPTPARWPLYADRLAAARRPRSRSSRRGEEKKNLARPRVLDELAGAG